MSCMSFRLSALAAAVVGALPFAASAQQLEEIIVTATRRESDLQSTPLSIQAFSAEKLELAGLERGQDLGIMVPNLVANPPGGGVGAPTFYVRGLPGVGIYIDGVWQSSYGFLESNFAEVERVEVLRGPQGTLYGKNTTGGAINFVTKKPDFRNEGFLTLGAGDYNRRTAEGAIGGALVDDRLAGRLAFSYTSADGWFENGFPGGPDLEAIDEYAVRVGLRYQPSDTLDVYLRLATSEQNSANYGIYARPGAAGVGGGLYALFNSFDPTLNPNTDYFRTGLGRYDIESNYTPDREASSHSAALTIDWQASDHFTVTSITSWDEGDLFVPEDTDGSPLQTLEIDYHNDARQIGEDLRLTSSLDGRFNFIAGAYVGKDTVEGSTEMRFFNDLDVNFDGARDALDCIASLDTLATPDPADDLFPVGCRAGNTFEQERKNWALYTDVTFDLTDRTTLGGGVRYTRDQGSMDPFTAQIRGSNGTVLANTIPGDPADLDAQTRREFDDSEVTGRLGVEHTLDSGPLLYVNLSRGYRSSAFNSQAFFDPSELTVVEPETLDAVEVGAKTEWFDRSLTLNVSAFHYNYENQQILDVDPATALQFTRNIDKSSIDGAEIELISRPVDSLTLHAGLAWLDAKIDKATLRGTDISGNTLPLAPEFSANAAADWELALGSTLVLGLHADASYSDGQFFEPFNTARLKQGSYCVANARIALHSSDERWELAAWGKNLTDEFYVTSAIDLIDSFGYDYFHVGAPRTFGVDATLRF